MAFRFFLVGAVAALGIDLPTGFDVDDWTHSGRTWWQARVAEFEARYGDASRDESGAPPSARMMEATETEAPDVDAAFDTVMEEVVTALAADAASDGETDAESMPQLVAGLGDERFGPSFADALNRWADGLSEPVEPATLALEAGGLAIETRDGVFRTHPMAASGGVGSADSGGNGNGIDAPPGDRRLADAVRQTGLAFQAWLALLQHGAVPMPSLD